MHVPVVKGIYGATKQLMNAIQSGQGGSFKDVVMVEWPQPGSYTLGFVAHRDCAWAGLPGAEHAHRRLHPHLAQPHLRLRRSCWTSPRSSP